MDQGIGLCGRGDRHAPLGRAAVAGEKNAAGSCRARDVMARGRIDIAALARDGDAEFHTDDETTPRVSRVVMPGLTVEALARQLQEIGRQNPDAGVVTVTMAPGDWLRISRALVPLGGGWPKVDAVTREVRDEAFFNGLACGLGMGVSAAVLISALLWGWA